MPRNIQSPVIVAQEAERKSAKLHRPISSSFFPLTFSMSPPPASGRSESGTARFLGSASSGILELLIFHPVDTVAKRLMSNQTRVH